MISPKALNQGEKDLQEVPDQHMSERRLYNGRLRRNNMREH